MKIKLGKYTTWWGPYQIAEKILFWKTKSRGIQEETADDIAIDKLGEWLASASKGDDHDTWFYKLLQWIESKKQRKIEIQIDSWDTWGMYHTLAMITLPMLRQLKATKKGSPIVDDKDVPVRLRSTSAPIPEPNQSDDYLHDRWDWVMDEMIWAFEQLEDEDNDAQFHTTNSKRGRVYDKKAHIAHNKRVQRGTTLFGKYFQGLWD